MFEEAGEAIGNIGRRLFRRKKAREIQDALDRWGERLRTLHLDLRQGANRTTPDGVIIDGSCRHIDPSEDSANEQGVP